MKASSSRPVTDPALLRSLLRNQVENGDRINTLISDYSKTSHTPKHRLLCRCRPNPMAINAPQMGFSHKAWCPISNQQKNIVSLAFTYTVCNRFLNFSIAASFAMTKGAGGLAISPNLQFRAIVPSNSPAFKLLLRSGSGRDGSAIRSSHKALFELFYAGLASPTDTLGNGTTLLHVG
jgi:hypothetical protein